MKFDFTLIVVTLIGALGPTVLVIVNSRARSREKAEDRKWQQAQADRDEQAAADREEVRRAAEAASVAAQTSQAAIQASTAQVVAASTTAAATLIASNREIAGHVAEASKSHDEKLEQIHTLVNSGMLRQMGTLLTALESNVRLMKSRFVDREPTAEEQADVDATQAQIDKLERDMEELEAATTFADAAKDFRASRTTP